MKIINAIILISILLMIQSCKKEISNDAIDNNTSSISKESDSTIVHVAGGQFTEDSVTGKVIGHAIYWRNGVAVPLTTSFSYATSIAISGNDVYVTGFMTTGNSFNIATYWKNGNAVMLTDGSNNARVTSIAINGSDVYAAGWVENNGNMVAAVWKNGVQTLLADKSFYSYANSIAVNGNDVYVVGGFMNGHLDSSTVMCWKNGVALPLTSYPFSYATSIVLKGSDVYIGGVSSLPGYSYAATYWKNGTLVPLMAGTFSSQANSIAVNDDSVYAVGFSDQPNSGAAYWQNGTFIPLSGVAVNDPLPGMVNSYASSVIVNGTDVYITGGTNNKFGNDRALYWKNGNPIFLKNGSDSTGLYANGIAIQ